MTEKEFIEKHLLSFKTFEEYTNEKLLKFYPIEDKQRFRIMIRPTDFCNFSCDYCFSYTKNKDNALNREQIDIMIDKVRPIENKFYYIHGGEPLSFKHLFYLLDRISEEKDDSTSILIQTNLKLFTKEHLEIFLNYLNNGLKIKISVSLHQNVNIKEYIEKFKLLIKYDLLNGIEIMYTQKNPKNLTVYKILKEMFPTQTSIYSIFNEMFKDIPTLNIRNDDSYMIETSSGHHPTQFDDFYKKGLNYSFKNMKCDAGLNGLLINHDGKIYRCQADLFIYKEPFETIETIDFKNLTLKICKNNTCLCDLHYTRTIIEN